MGLDTTHNCWHVGYSAFTRWRNHVAEAAGYRVLPVRYDSGIHFDTIMLEWHRYGETKELLGEWDETPPDPLIVLFAHSDCEGVIHPAQAGPLADRLDAIVPAMQEEERAKTLQFIAGLREAVTKGEDVAFH